MKTNGKKSSPALAKGQLWRTEQGHIRIVELGKMLVHYKMLRDLRQMRRTQMSRIDNMVGLPENQPGAVGGEQCGRCVARYSVVGVIGPHRRMRTAFKCRNGRLSRRNQRRECRYRRRLGDPHGIHTGISVASPEHNRRDKGRASKNSRRGRPEMHRHYGEAEARCWATASAIVFTF